VTPASLRRAWLGVAACAVVLAVSQRTPAPDDALAPATAVPARGFSAARARVHLEALATGIGRRVGATPAATRAADYLEAALHRLGIETTRQVASGSYALRGQTQVYQGVTNVLARMPGRSARAILVSAHYDSAAEGPGAADNALAVAAVLEVARALAAGPPLDHTVIFNLDGGEELGLLGAAAFVDHPWFADVAAFINLDASGGRGRQMLVQATPGAAALVEAYAASVPQVQGSVLVQELYGLFPFDTDYHAYRDAGLPGLDLATYDDTYAYHTPLDRPERVSPRTLQEVGDNLLALVRRLPAADRPAPRARLTTYYDVAGLTLVRYGAPTATVLAVLAALGALAAAWGTGRRERRPLIELAVNTSAIAVATAGAIAVPLVVACVVTLAGGAMAWFAHRWIAPAVYVTASVAGVVAGLGVAGWIARRWLAGAALTLASLSRGLAVCWAIAVAALTVAGLASAYLAMWWCIGAAIAVAAARLRNPGMRGAVVALGFAPGAVLLAQAARIVLTSLIPLAGGLGAGAPVEMIIAGTTALLLGPFAVALAPLLRISPRGPVTACLAVAAAVNVALLVVVFPYSAARPKRMYAEARSAPATGSRLTFEASDPGPLPALPSLAPGPPLPPPVPRITTRPRASPSVGEVEIEAEIEVEIDAPGAYLVELRLDGEAPRWSLGDGSDRPARWIGTAEPLRFRVAHPPGQPAAVHAIAHYLDAPATAAPALAALPAWTVPMIETVREAHATL